MTGDRFVCFFCIYINVNNETIPYMTNTNKLQMVEAGLELETKLSKQLWNDMWGDTIGKGLFHLEVNFRCPIIVPYF